MAKRYDKRKTIIGADGKRYDIRANSDEELFAKIIKKKEQVAKRLDTTGGNMTLSKWANTCIDTYKPKQKDVTKEKYRERSNIVSLSILATRSLKILPTLSARKS